MAKLEEVIDRTSVVSRALQSVVDYAFHFLMVALREHSFDKDTSFSRLEEPEEQGTVFALDQNVNLVLADPPYSTPSAQAENSSAYSSFCRKNLEEDVRFIRNVVFLKFTVIYFVSM